LNKTGEVVLDPVHSVERAFAYLEHQDGWSGDIGYEIVRAPGGAGITVVLHKDIDFTLLGPLLPGEDPLHVTVTAFASPNVIAP
jgi:hypothetical protein